MFLVGLKAQLVGWLAGEEEREREREKHQDGKPQRGAIKRKSLAYDDERTFKYWTVMEFSGAFLAMHEREETPRCMHKTYERN